MSRARCRGRGPLRARADMLCKGMGSHAARFAPGQLIRHRLFDYRGVVTDVDASFQLSDQWYEQVARTRPPKDRPWYHVLVHDSAQMTYVAERNLAADPSGEPIRHPLLADFFQEFRGGRYCARRSVN